MTREKPVEFSIPGEEQLPSLPITRMSGGWESKCWGMTRQILRSPLVSAHELFLLEPESFCSVHRHQRRHNIFLVLSGRVRVVVEGRTQNVEMSHLLEPGDSLRVFAGELHQFQVIERAHLLELYVPIAETEVEDSDIQRLHIGGVKGVPMKQHSRFLVSDGWVST